ncbi:MAG: glycosyl transferase family 1 [Microbacterium sp.]|nr:MAG: glycosyl transferase family 1 [Microbacterium sp.]
MSSPTVLVAHPGAEMYGSDRVLLDSVVGLVGSGARVVVALPGEGPLADALRTSGATVTVADAFVLRKRLMRPSGWGELLRTGWRGLRSAWRLIGQTRPDVVYVSTITLPVWPVLARLRRVPVALHVHEGEASAGRVTKAVLYAPALFARRILVNSTFSLNVMTSAYRRLGGRSVVVANAVPGPDRPTPPRAELDGGLRVLFVGRLSPRKGPDLVVDAVRLLAERGVTASLEIVGSAFEGYEDYVRAMEQSIAAADLEDRVALRGFHADIWGFLSDNDVLVVPSRLDEPFGNTAVEGVLAARPVVVSDTSGLREATAGIDTALRVQPDSATAIADALLSMIERWPHLRDRVEASRRLAAERHAPAAYQRRVAELITGLSARP